MREETKVGTDRLPPIHPGTILSEEFLLPMNITQYHLAKSIGVDARRIPLYRAWQARHHSGDGATFILASSGTRQSFGWGCKASMTSK